MIGIGFGGFEGFELEDEKSERKTWPPPGSATMIIEDEQEALFFSATWTVRCRVDGRVLYESKPRDESHPPGFVAQWARFILRRYAKELRTLGVDVINEYTKLGGREDELSL